MEDVNAGAITLRKGVENPVIAGFFSEFRLLDGWQIADILRKNPDIVSVLEPNGHVLGLISQSQELHPQALSLGEGLQADLVGRNQEIFEAIGGLMPEKVQEFAIGQKPHFIRFLKNPSPMLQVMAVKASPELVLLLGNPCWQAQYEAMVAETAHHEVPLLKKMLDAGQAIHEEALLAASEKWKPFASCEAGYDAACKELVGKLPARLKELKKGIGKESKEAGSQGAPSETQSSADPPLSKDEYSLLKEVAEGKRGELGVASQGEKYLFRNDGSRISLCADKSFAAGNILYFIPSISEQVQMKIVDKHGIRMVGKMKNPCDELKRRYQLLVESEKKLENEQKAIAAKAIIGIVDGLLARRQRMAEEMKEKERIMLSVQRKLPSVLREIRQLGVRH
ncbi:MAG: hypothetical protein NTX79_06765 [Candidatus Micrarchaeota archaeon]|nr:hypothetical protein [Candidatus Micrarchaeota archaeon]